MLNYGYTCDTKYRFTTECCPTENNVNKVGVFPQDKIEKVLQCKSTGDQWVQFFIPEIVDIPNQKPNIEGLVGVHSCIEIISQRVVKTPVVTGYTSANGQFISGDTIPNAEGTKLTGKKLVIEGFIRQKIIYTALNSEQSLHSAHFIMPFSTFIILDKDTPLSKKFNVLPYIEDVYALQLSTRSVFKNTTIFISAVPIC